MVSVTALGEVTADGPLMPPRSTAGRSNHRYRQLSAAAFSADISMSDRVLKKPSCSISVTRLHAGIDCSDGLSVDLWHLCEESRCGALIAVERVPIAPDAHELSNQHADRISPLEHALSDGEDFELILAVPPESAERMLADQPLENVPLSDIGQFVSERGLWTESQSASRQPITPRGFEHRFT